MTTVTVLAGRERRRRWTSSEKQRIVEESLAPETTVVEVARRHDIHPNLLHLWRRQARRGTATPAGRPDDAPDGKLQFASVAIAADERVSTMPPGLIEIEFASGARLRISGPVDAATLSAVIAAAARDGRR
jgi:transposase